jgi:hypothetical protein
LEVSILEQAPNGTIFKPFNTATIQSDAIPEVEFISFHPSLPILIWGQKEGMMAWQYLVPGE